MTAQKFIPNLPDAGPRDGWELARVVNWLIRRVVAFGSGILLADGDKGDITVSGAGTTWTIDNDVVTYAKMQNVVNNNRVLGRISGAGGDTEELTGAQLATLIGAGILTKGTSTMDFGAFPGASDASITVTGQAGILTTSYVDAHLLGVATVDHSSDEHLVETIRIVPMDIIAGTGFTIKGVNTNQISEPLLPLGGGANNDALAGGLVVEQGAQQSSGGGRGTRLYGTWNVAWAWSN